MDHDSEENVSVSDDESLDEYDNDYEDIIMNVIDGSDDDESENEEVVYVPKLRTLTRGGRLAGTWQTCFSLDNEAESDEEANSNCDMSDSDSVENDEPDNDSDSVKAVTSMVSKRVLSDSESASDSTSDSSSEESDTSEDERNVVRTRTGRVSKRPNRIDV